MLAWQRARPGERLLEVDVPLSYGVADVSQTSAATNNVVEFMWDPTKEVGVYIKVIYSFLFIYIFYKLDVKNVNNFCFRSIASAQSSPQENTVVKRGCHSASSLRLAFLEVHVCTPLIAR